MDQQPEALLGEVKMVYKAGTAFWLICASEHTDDFGTVFTVETTRTRYAQILDEFMLPTLHGCLIEVDDGDFDIVEEPADPPASRINLPLHRRRRGDIAVMPTNGINKWPWGRCCCVPHPKTGAPTPLTKTVLQTDKIWWPSPRTPFELDLHRTAKQDLAMHIMDTICPTCQHPVWYIEPEVAPEATIFEEMDLAAKAALEKAQREDGDLCSGLDTDADYLTLLIDLDEPYVPGEPISDVRATIDAADAAIDALRRVLEAS